MVWTFFKRLVQNLKPLSDIVLFAKNPIPQPSWNRKQLAGYKKRSSQVVLFPLEFLCFSSVIGIYRHIHSSQISLEIFFLENYYNKKSYMNGNTVPEEKISQGYGL